LHRNANGMKYEILTNIYVVILLGSIVIKQTK
jgi:hypothetical protein